MHPTPRQRYLLLFLIPLAALGFSLVLLLQLETAFSLPSETAVSCQNNLADGTYPCRNIDLLSFVPLTVLNSSAANDIWGWTDPDTGKEYALVGLVDGVAFVDISQPMAPVYLGTLPTQTGTAVQRDLKVYQNMVYVVSEALGHGMQLFDLTQLRTVSNPPQPFTNTVHYNHFGRAHNIAINEESGFAYVVGIQEGTETCNRGLHMVDIRQPLNPVFAGCFGDDGYTHDTQCVIYHGADTRYTGHEICFNANTDTLTIVDVTDKSTPVMLARVGYSGVAYAHQGWLTADHNHFLLNDENDERNFGHNTRTYIWDVANLEVPFVDNSYMADSPAIDHNLYLHDNLVFAANYRSGLRVLAPTNGDITKLHETAYFDIFPEDDAPNFNGAWSSYPFFESGSIIVSGREQGLFVLKLVRDAAFGPPSTLVTSPQSNVTHTLSLINNGIDGRFSLTLEKGSWPTSLGITSTLFITANTTVSIPIHVSAPDLVQASDTFTLTAVSQADDGQTLVVTGTTTTAVSPALLLQPATSTAEGDLGDTITPTFTLTNTGNYTDTFALSVSDQTWATQVASQTVPLAPNEQITIPVQVDIPPLTNREQVIVASDSFTLTATSGWETAVFTTALGTTYATTQPALQTSGDASLFVQPGQMITHTITITNSGNYTDTFDLELDGNSWTTFSTVDDTGPLAPQAATTLDVIAIAPASGVDTVTVTLRSRLDEAIFAQLQLHTHVHYRAYLPYMSRATQDE